MVKSRTDRKRCIRVNRAEAQVCSKMRSWILSTWAMGTNMFFFTEYTQCSSELYHTLLVYMYIVVHTHWHLNRILKIPYFGKGYYWTLNIWTLIYFCLIPLYSFQWTVIFCILMVLWTLNNPGDIACYLCIKQGSTSNILGNLGKIGQFLTTAKWMS